VGDLAETLALVLPDAVGDEDDAPRPGLAETVATTIHSLRDADEPRKREVVTATWRRLEPRERIVWHKLITGGLRVGVSRTLVARALAEVAGIEPAVMTHRLMGAAGSTLDADGFARLLAAQTAADDRRPYPFFLASALDQTEPAAVATAEAESAVTAEALQRAELQAASPAQPLPSDEDAAHAELAQDDPPAQLPIVPQYGEHHEAFIIVCDNAIDEAWLRAKLGLDELHRSYKDVKALRPNVLTVQQFRERLS
jgi:hypothetical protein